MIFFQPFFIAFILIFISELGDKTQLLVLSFSSKLKTPTILLGVALGTFLSHGIAILFGSSITFLENESLHTSLKLITYLTFILFGIFSFISKKEKGEKKEKILNNFYSFSLYYILIIAISIAIGELGDKTFIASIGLGINYPTRKIALILGSILGMVSSNAIAIIFGKILNKYISEKKLQILSGILFLLFGLIGLIKYLI